MFQMRFGLRPAIAVLACCSIFYAVGLWQTSLLGGGFTALSPLGFNRLSCPPEQNPNASADDVVVVKNAIFHGEHENENENENDPISSTRSEKLKLDFELHHQTERVPLEAFSNTSENDDMPPFELCDMSYSEYSPCEDPANSRRFTTRMMISRERHCPGAEQRELLRCLIPAPLGYRAPFPWPKSREHAWYANVPHKRLAVAKADQNWIRFEKDRFFFPGGGTSFPSGARKYIESLAKLVPLSDGSIRTALDTGCGYWCTICLDLWRFSGPL